MVGYFWGGFLFSLLGHQKKERWETKGGVFFFFLGKRGGEKVEQVEKVEQKVENLEMLPALMVSNKHSTNRYENGMQFAHPQHLDAL